MDMLYEVLGFAAKGFVVFLTIAVSAAAVFALSRRRRGGGAGPGLEVRKLNKRFKALGDTLRAGMLTRKESKAFLKEQDKAAKGEEASATKKPSVFVLDFEGDLLATAVGSLREEVSAIVEVAAPEDEVVVRLESPGGAVPHYGLAAAQLVRLKERKVKVTVCVDRVAASGGYMMACVADRIVAAPFSIVGSIGVVAQVPNVHRLLKKLDVDYQELTAGEFKRTISVFGEITDKGRAKFVEQLEETHVLFKDFIHAQRPALELSKVATGEYWLGTRALQLGLVDQLGTSDAYLLQRSAEANLYGVKYTPASTWRERLGRVAGEMAERALVQVLGRLRSFELP
jgi:serine protease SohB